MGGRRGQAEIDQELGQKEGGNAFDHRTSPQGAFNGQAIEPKTHRQNNLFRARSQASACKNKSFEAKDRSTRRGLSIETTTASAQAVGNGLCRNVSARRRRGCGRGSVEAAAVVRR
jgi:hypothetical protein